MTCVVFLHPEFLIAVISIVCEVYHSLCSGVLLPRFELGEKNAQEPNWCNPSYIKCRDFIKLITFDWSLRMKVS